MTQKSDTNNERIVGVIKHLRGKDLSEGERKELGVEEDEYVNRVVKENSPRSFGYEKSCGRFLDLVRSL